MPKATGGVQQRAAPPHLPHAIESTEEEPGSGGGATAGSSAESVAVAMPLDEMGDEMPGKHCCKRRRRYPVDGRRVIIANDPNANLQSNSEYLVSPTNSISNAKYTPLAAFPFLNIYEQFYFNVNRYFLMIACLQLIRTITPVSPITTWGPLILIFTATAAKDLRDDLKRRRSDREFNSKHIEILLQADKPNYIKSEDIRIGDIILLNCDDAIPCDVAILKTSDPKGLAYVTTANLDGETDLKERRAVKETHKLDRAALCNFSGALVCGMPNRDITSFNSYMVFQPSQNDRESLETNATKISLSQDNTLWQGTSLKKVEWVLAMAVYTGMETRVGMNTKPPERKTPQTDVMVDVL